LLSFLSVYGYTKYCYVYTHVSMNLLCFCLIFMFVAYLWRWGALLCGATFLGQNWHPVTLGISISRVLLKAYSRYQKLKNGNLQNIIKDITKIYILQVHTYYKYNIINIVLNIYDIIWLTIGSNTTILWKYYHFLEF